MHKIPSPTNELIYRKSLKQPIVLSQQNSIDFFSIAGWKNWSTPFITSMLSENLFDHEFYIKVVTKRTNGDDRIHLLSVPSLVFTYIDNDKICDYIRKLLFHHFGPDSVIFDVRDDGFLFFQVLDVNLEISFSPFLCKFFGFDVETVYSVTSSKQAFVIFKGFRDFRANVVGISLNFVYNPDLSETVNDDIKRYQIISLLDTTGTSFSAYYKKIMISQPEYNVYKSLSCQHLELRFIDLSTGKVLSSIFPDDHPQEIYVKISFC